MEGGRATGVLVRKGDTDLRYEIRAKCVISDAGLYNTFMKLLPEPVAKKSYFRQLAEELRPSYGSQYAFIGLNASNEELGLKVRSWHLMT